ARLSTLPLHDAHPMSSCASSGGCSAAPAWHTSSRNSTGPPLPLSTFRSSALTSTADSWTYSSRGSVSMTARYSSSPTHRPCPLRSEEHTSELQSRENL